MDNIMQFEDGFCVAIGYTVQFCAVGLSGEGRVRGFKDGKVLIDPDWRACEFSGEYGYHMLSPEQAEKHGRPDFCEVRDHGVPGGCITATKPYAPGYVPLAWTERYK